ELILRLALDADDFERAFAFELLRDALDALLGNAELVRDIGRAEAGFGRFHQLDDLLLERRIATTAAAAVAALDRARRRGGASRGRARERAGELLQGGGDRVIVPGLTDELFQAIRKRVDFRFGNELFLTWHGHGYKTILPLRANLFSIEYDGFISVNEYSILDMPAHRARQHRLLQLAPFLQQIVELVAVRDAAGRLLDDRPVVELLGHVVAGGADQLDAALVRLVIRLRADERRQERMVDVDDAVAILGDESGRQHLHVAREHDQLDGLAAQERERLH